VWTHGRFLWTRTIASTIVGQGCDSVIFYPLAFGALWDSNKLLTVMLVNWWFKVAVEVLMTPLTYVIVNALKRAEREDFMDEHTNFNPFRLQG
jgi:hypothetical protein